VTAALQKHIDAEKLVIVSAGDFETKAVAGGERQNHSSQYSNQYEIKANSRGR